MQWHKKNSPTKNYAEKKTVNSQLNAT